jgi:hypothetical protein
MTWMTKIEVDTMVMLEQGVYLFEVHGNVSFCSSQHADRLTVSLGKHKIQENTCHQSPIAQCCASERYPEPHRQHPRCLVVQLPSALGVAPLSTKVHNGVQVILSIEEPGAWRSSCVFVP